VEVIRDYQRSILVGIAIFILLSAVIQPAAAWSFKDKIFPSFAPASTDNKLDKIEEQIDALSEDEKLMKFVNRNMWEQKVRVIECAITEDDELLDTYYIIREEKGSTARIDDAWSGIGNKWTFKPTIKKTEKAIKLLESQELTVNNVLKCILLWISVEKQGVPSINNIIQNSTWLDQFLPSWW